MKEIIYKGSIFINPSAAGLETIGLSATDVAGVMKALARDEALQRRDVLLQAAALRIAPLQDAKDLDKATGEETAQLLAWKQYRIDLNRISDQKGFPMVIDWPESPAQ